MKKLTKKQRHEIYKKALNKLENGCYFMCHAIERTSDFNADSKNFPELWLFKPLHHKNDNGWFCGENELSYDQRVEIKFLILMFCIEMTR